VYRRVVTCRVGAFAAIVCMLMPSCSLEGLASYETAHCDATHMTCAGLNARDHLDGTACMQWNCEPRSHACVFGPRDADGDGEPAPECGGHDCDDNEALRRPGMEEHCDGLDNDCNDLIDDGVEPEGLEATDLVSVAVPAQPRGSYATHANATQATLLVVATSHASVIELRSPNPVVQDVGNVSPTPSYLDADYGAGERCPLTDPLTTVGCNESEAALDIRSDGQAIAAVISDAECPVGRLRVGLLDRSMGLNVRYQGPSSIASAFPTLDAVGSSCGVGETRPSLALLDDTHALLVYLHASTRTVTGCIDGRDDEVVAVGLTLGTRRVPLTSVSVSVIDASPIMMVGRTSVLAPPALLAVPDVGWLIAMPLHDGTIGAWLVSPFTASSSLTLTSVGNVPTSAGSAGHIALALGDTVAAGGLAVGMGYVGTRDEMGACTSTAPATFQGLVLDTASRSLRADGASLALPIANDLALTYVPQGFRAAHGTVPESGGFLMLTTNDRGVSAFRISSVDHTLVDPAPIPVTSASSHLPYLHPDGERAYLAFVRDRTVVTGHMLCAPPAP